MHSEKIGIIGRGYVGNRLEREFTEKCKVKTGYSGLRDTSVRRFGNRHSGKQGTVIPVMETASATP